MLSKKYILKKDNDFKAVFKRGKSYSYEFIRIKVLKNDLGFSRFGIIIGLKVSKKAIERNKTRRRLSEFIRLEKDKIKKGFDIVVLTNSEIVKKDYQEIKQVMLDLFTKAELIK